VFFLTVVGNVQNFVSIVPKRVVLRGVAGDPIKATVRIIPEENYPFTVKDVKAGNTKNIRFSLEKVENSKKPEFVLSVENLKKDKGRYFDTIRLKTDSKIRPEIKVNVIGNILDRVENRKQSK